LAHKSVSNSIPASTLKKLRALIKKSPWRTASSPQYRNAPHSYIIAFWYTDNDKNYENKTAWKWFADVVSTYGEYRTWRGHKYKYLIVDRKCYWVDFPALNRAALDTLDHVAGQDAGRSKTPFHKDS
jgi:hypothetical protein